MIAHPVSVIATGDYAPGSITIQRIELPGLPAELNDFVEAKWRREVELNPSLYAGEILSPATLRISADSIEIDCGLSDYREFMGTTWPEVPERHRRRALGQVAVTITKDNRLIIGRRSLNIDWGGLRHAMPAGRVQPNEGSPEEAILLEFREETGILPEEIASLRGVAVLEDLTSGRHNFEIVYLARIALTADELVERIGTAEHSFEHDRVETYAWEPAVISEALRNEPAGFTPAGFAGVAVALRHAFGEAAFPLWEVQAVTYEEYMNGN